MWFGTRGGACRYDGDTFTYFTQKEGLKHSSVWAITEDRYGNIWFGTDGGVTQFIPQVDGMEGQLVHYDAKNGFANDLVLSILEDESGQLWFGTFNGIWLYTHFCE